MTNESHIHTIEINGVKLDVDLRTAVVRKQENLKVGDFVKILAKDYSGHTVIPGVVVGFDAFNAKPTLILAKLGVTWSSVDISFMYYNADTKDTEVIKACEDDTSFSPADVLTSFERAIATKKAEVAVLESKRDFFIKHFGRVYVPETVE